MVLYFRPLALTISNELFPCLDGLGDSFGSNGFKYKTLCQAAADILGISAMVLYFRPQASTAVKYTGSWLN